MMSSFPHTGPTKTHVTARGLVVPPILPAVASPDGVNAVLWCRYCDKLHWHGNGDGGRVAHCFVYDSPYRETGYVLEMVGGAVAGLVPPRRERRRPRLTHRGATYVHGWDEEASPRFEARQLPHLRGSWSWVVWDLVTDAPADGLPVSTKSVVEKGVRAFNDDHRVERVTQRVYAGKVATP